MPSPEISPITHNFNNGDGGPANKAYLSGPTSVSVDRDGNLYIADGNRIRKVNTSGTITSVAGNGYTGDGGMATLAQITHAADITFDNRGNFYFSQYYGNGDVIRKVSADGLISTVAGKGAPGMAGENGAATKAQLMQPHRLSIDAQGFVIIPDRGNKLVRKVSVKSYDQKEIHFSEDNGLGHLIAADGKHSLTYDLETGVPLLEFSYDSDNRLTAITDQFGNVVGIEYLLGVPSAIVSPDGLRTKLSIDDYIQLKGLTYPDGHAFTFEYEKNDGLLTAKNEPNGNRFEHFFDETGRVTKTNNQEQGLWQFSREATADGQVTSTTTTPNTTTTVKRRTKSTGAVDSTVTAASGEVVTTTTSTDGLDSTSTSSCGMQVKSSEDLDPWFDHTSVKSTTVTTPAGLSLTTSLDTAYVDDNSDGQFESVTHTATANGKTATVEHDVVNATQTVISPEGRTITSNYDSNTLQTTSNTVLGLLATKYAYRTDGKLSSITSGTRTTGYTYDTAGNLATITDPLSRVTKFTDYDASGRLKRVERADTSVIQYDYDENGNMTLYRTPLTADNSFAYNGVNKAASFTTPLGSTTSYAYNAERQLTKVTLPSSKTIVNTYANGLLTETGTPEWTNSYAYSCGELLDSITRGSEKIAYSYDGELVTGIAQSGTFTAGIGMTYNNDFQLDSLTYGGGTEELGYDKDGLLINSGGFAIGRRSDNGLPETVAGGNLTLTRTFNGYGEVERADTAVSGSVFRYDLIRDANGRIKSKTETIGGTSSVLNYTYDPVGRLRTVTKDGKLVEEYRYDKNGNRTYQMNAALGIADRTFSHSVEDHTLTAGPITYQFDYDDNLSTRTENGETTQYVYSTTGELRNVTLPDGTVVSYVHAPLGRRIAKKVNGTIVEKYLWSGQTTLLAVYDGYDNLRQRFEYADSRLPNVMMAGGSIYYLAYDQVGTIRLVTDGSGNTVKRIDYDTFGNIISDSNPSFTIPFGFAGGLHDRETKLVRFGYRDYLPEIGKWTAKDPILFAGGDSNLFGYVEGDPVNGIDPMGLIDCKKEFFSKLLDAIKKIAEKYNFDPNYLLAISAHESGWLGPHAHELNNAFGLTQGGGNNLSFESFSESVETWGKTFGEKAAGATSIDDFINKLQTDQRSEGGRGKYNTEDPNWGTHIRDVYDSVVRRRGPLCQ